jgi:hypothetical protein
MQSETSPAAVLYTQRLEPVAAGGASSREISRVAPAVGAIAVAGASLGRGLRRVVSALGSFAEIVAVAYAFPLVILAIGIPVALLVRLAMWIVRAL